MSFYVTRACDAWKSSFVVILWCFIAILLHKLKKEIKFVIEKDWVTARLLFIGICGTQLLILLILSTTYRAVRQGGHVSLISSLSPLSEKGVFVN